MKLRQKKKSSSKKKRSVSAIVTPKKIGIAVNNAQFGIKPDVMNQKVELELKVKF